LISGIHAVESAPEQSLLESLKSYNWFFGLADGSPAEPSPKNACQPDTCDILTRRANHIYDNQKYGRLSIPLCKNILLFRNRKSPYDNPHPVPPEGAYRAIVTDVGHGMRWTQVALAARKRCPMMAQLASGQAVGAWHPDAGVKLVERSTNDGGLQARHTGATSE
jgi:hypothetical protein